jgi:histidine triad (HIT) family protein
MIYHPLQDDNMDCIFCKIVNGEIPSFKVYEDGHVFAFLDLNPVSRGHTLVIPKKHVERLSDADSEDIHNIFTGVKEVAKIIDKISKDYNIGINQGKLAFQIINHLHIHIMPRYQGDGLAPWPPGKLTQEEARQILEKLK